MSHARLLEVNELCLIRFDAETCVVQPFLTDCLPGSDELVHISPLFCTGKECSIVYIHPKTGIVPMSHLMQQTRHVMIERTGDKGDP